MEELVFNFPFQKIDKARRVVTGVATADNVDPVGDRVEFGGSIDAFNSWMGNMREMHGKNAIGKSLSHRPVTVEYQGKTYRGIEVDAYISKGAEDTWQKVLDGTLRGFSIGGGVIEKSTEYDPELKRKVNNISKYSLGELSLVDNPGNPAAMFSMVKMASDGVLEETTANDRYQIFYCQEHKISKANSDECFSCDTPMADIGFADEFSMEIINKMVESHFEKGSQMTTEIEKAEACKDCAAMEGDLKCKACSGEAKVEKSDDGADIAKVADLLNSTVDGNVNNTDLSPEKVSLLKGVFNSVIEFINGPHVEIEAEVVETKVEKVAEIVQEDGGPEVDITELTNALSVMMDDKLTKVKDELASDFGSKLEAITKSVTEVQTQVETAVGEVTEKVATIEGSGAIKKSVDTTDELETEVKVEKTTFWGGLFVPQAICEVLGYDS